MSKKRNIVAKPITDYEISVSGNDLVLTDPIFQEEQTFVRAGTD